MTKFKICGLREASHAQVAADAGASFLGFVFVPGVRRQLTEERGKQVIDELKTLKGGVLPKLVGLFANQPLDEVNRIVGTCGLDLVQLCGDESSEYLGQVSARVIKQIKVRDDLLENEVIDDVLRRVDEVVSAGHRVVLDKYEAGSLGGTGRSFNWNVAKEVAKRYDILLAGGLNPENVGTAIASVTPWGVDVSSGVEVGGIKCEDKIVAFAEAVRQATASYSESR